MKPRIGTDLLYKKILKNHLETVKSLQNVKLTPLKLTCYFNSW